jgi:parvulin-like peptidyl-prolyl isomerase
MVYGWAKAVKREKFSMLYQSPLAQCIRLICLSICSIFTASAVVAQQAPAGKAAATLSPEAAAVKKANETKRGEVLATVNGEPITRGEIIQFLSKYELPANIDTAQIYKTAIDVMCNTKMVMQSVKASKTNVAPAEIDAEVEKLKTALTEQKTDLAKVLAESGRSMDELRAELEQFLLWKKYVTREATDAVLNKFIADNKAAFNGDQVRASHILKKTTAETTAAQKDAIKKQLQEIKQQIATGKMTFAEAANKFSEDEGNKEKVGGDLGLFFRKGQFIEPFAAAAFGLKKGEISDLIETPFGYHLILVTERKDGKPVDPNDPNVKNAALDAFAQERQEKLVTDAKKMAKIDIKPMPTDLFPPAPKVTAPKVTAPTVAPSAK